MIGAVAPFARQLDEQALRLPRRGECGHTYGLNPNLCIPRHTQDGETRDNHSDKMAMGAAHLCPQTTATMRV